MAIMIIRNKWTKLMMTLIIKSTDQLLDKSTIFECLPSHRGLAFHCFFFLNMWNDQAKEIKNVMYIMTTIV